MVFLLGGMAYRQDCIDSNAQVEKNWTGSIFTLIPYVLRPSKEGCETHTATRVALSSLGIAKIGSDDVIAARITGDLESGAAEDDAEVSGDAEGDEKARAAYFKRLYALNVRATRDIDVGTATAEDLPELVAALQKYVSDLEELEPPASVAQAHEQLIADNKVGEKAMRAMRDATTAEEFEEAQGEMEAAYEAIKKDTEALQKELASN